LEAAFLLLPRLLPPLLPALLPAPLVAEFLLEEGVLRLDLLREVLELVVSVVGSEVELPIVLVPSKVLSPGLTTWLALSSSKDMLIVLGMFISATSSRRSPCGWVFLAGEGAGGCSALGSAAGAGASSAGTNSGSFCITASSTC